MSNLISRRHAIRFPHLACALLCVVGLTLFVGCSRSADASADQVPNDQSATSASRSTTDAPDTAETPRERSICPRNRPTADEDDDPQTRLIRTLDDALDHVDAGDEDVDKDDLRGILREADHELRHVLGGKSKEAILRANRKPPVCYRHEPPIPAVTPDEAATPKADGADGEAPSEKPAP